MFVPVPPGPTPERTAAPPTPISREDELDLRAVVGPNADHFLRCWHVVLTGRGTGTGFSRVAFFLPFVWLVYRRMYRRAVTLFLVFLAIGLVDTFVFALLFRLEQTPTFVVLVEAIVAASLCGGYANLWYLRHVQRIIADARSRHKSPSAVQEELVARGSTDIGSAFGLLLVLVLFELLVRFGGVIAPSNAPPPGEPPAIRSGVG